MNRGKLSQSNHEEVTKEQLAKLGVDKFYIAPRRDNIICSETDMHEDTAVSPRTADELLRQNNLTRKHGQSKVTRTVRVAE